jgi:CheY-like chemotaxis protein
MCVTTDSQRDLPSVGEEVAEIANTFQPDILVTDVVMGAMNGIEAAKLVRQMLPSCKIVLLSGRASAAELLDGARDKGTN